MALQNRDVVDAWKSGKAAESVALSLSTNGRDLYSYALKIGYTSERGDKVLILYTGDHSVTTTTSRHVRTAMRVANILVTPEALKGHAK